MWEGNKTARELEIDVDQIGKAQNDRVARREVMSAMLGHEPPKPQRYVFKIDPEETGREPARRTRTLKWFNYKDKETRLFLGECELSALPDTAAREALYRTIECFGAQLDSERARKCELEDKKRQIAARREKLVRATDTYHAVRKRVEGKLYAAMAEALNDKKRQIAELLGHPFAIPVGTGDRDIATPGPDGTGSDVYAQETDSEGAQSPDLFQ